MSEGLKKPAVNGQSNRWFSRTVKADYALQFANTNATAYRSNLFPLSRFPIGFVYTFQSYTRFIFFFLIFLRQVFLNEVVFIH